MCTIEHTRTVTFLPILLLRDMPSQLLLAINALIARVELPLDDSSAEEVATLASELNNDILKTKTTELLSALARLNTRVADEMQVLNTKASRQEMVDDILNERIVTHKQFVNDPMMSTLKKLANRITSDLKRHAVGKRVAKPALSKMNRSIYTALVEKYILLFGSPMRASDPPLKRKLTELYYQHQVNDLRQVNLEPKDYTRHVKGVLQDLEHYGFADLKQRVVVFAREYLKTRLSTTESLDYIHHVWHDLKGLMEICGFEAFITHLQASIDKMVANGEFYYHDRVQGGDETNVFMLILYDVQNRLANLPSAVNYEESFLEAFHKLKYEISGCIQGEGGLKVSAAAWVKGKSSANLWEYMLAKGSTRIETMCQVMELALTKDIHPRTAHARVLQRVRTRIQEYDGLIHSGQISRQKARSDGLACLRELEILLTRTPAPASEPAPIIGGVAKKKTIKR